MWIMFKWCMEKNPWNKLDQNAQNHQKPQFLNDVKIIDKMHERMQFDQK